MNAGRLRHQVILYKPVDTQNTYGEPEVRWQKVADLWARIEPLQGREYFAAKQAVSEIEARVTIRYRSDVTARMKITHGANDYLIETIINPGERNKELQLMCRRLNL
jgi:SPP1 family predicted phage head-tail adaptor